MLQKHFILSCIREDMDKFKRYITRERTSCSKNILFYLTLEKMGMTFILSHIGDDGDDFYSIPHQRRQENILFYLTLEKMGMTFILSHIEEDEDGSYVGISNITKI